MKENIFCDVEHFSKIPLHFEGNESKITALLAIDGYKPLIKKSKEIHHN